MRLKIWLNHCGILSLFFSLILMTSSRCFILSFFCCNFCICISFVYFQPCLDMVPISQYQLCDAHLSTISSFYQIVAPMNRFSLIPTSIHKFGSQILPGLRLANLQSILLVDIAGWYIGSIFLRH